MGPCAGGTGTDLNTDSGGRAHRTDFAGQAGEVGSSVAGQGQDPPTPNSAQVTMLGAPTELRLPEGL